MAERSAPRKEARVLMKAMKVDWGDMVGEWSWRVCHDGEGRGKGEVKWL